MSDRKHLTGIGYAIPPKKLVNLRRGSPGKSQKAVEKGVCRPSSHPSSENSREKKRVIVQENGTRKSMTKDEAAFKQLFQQRPPPAINSRHKSLWLT